MYETWDSFFFVFQYHWVIGHTVWVQEYWNHPDTEIEYDFSSLDNNGIGSDLFH